MTPFDQEYRIPKSSWNMLKPYLGEALSDLWETPSFCWQCDFIGLSSRIIKSQRRQIMGWGIPRCDSNYPPHFFLTSKVHYIQSWNRSGSFHPPFQWGCSLIKSRITFTYIIIPPSQEAAKSFLWMHILPRPWNRFHGVLLESLPFFGARQTVSMRNFVEQNQLEA